MQWNRNSVRDPVCGVYLDPSRAIARMVQGRVFYFCEEECAEKFLAKTRPASQTKTNRIHNRPDKIAERSAS